MTMSVARSLRPATGFFTRSRPAFTLCVSCYLRSVPPRLVSSTSNGFKPGNSWSLYDFLNRRAKCQADFCVMPKSRCSFMLDTPLGLVLIRYNASPHSCSDSLELCISGCVRTLKYRRHSRHRNCYGLRLRRLPMRLLAQFGHLMSYGQRPFTNQAAAAFSVPNSINKPGSERSVRCHLTGPLLCTVEEHAVIP